MNLFQGKIYINDGKISSLEKEDGYVSVISESSENRFNNCYAFPGLTDHHGHIVGLGTKLLRLDFGSCMSAEECCLMAAKSDVFEGVFLEGRGWNEQLWGSKELPTKEILDFYFQDVPVYFVRIDGHAAWVNSKALEITGIGSGTKDPDGGMIMRDKAGNATGILIDNAMNLVRRYIPEPESHQIKSYIKVAIDALMKAGIVCVHDMDVPSNYLPIFNEMDFNGELGIKIKSFISPEAIEWKNQNISDLSSNKFSIQGLKFFADGALGSRGAWLLNSYLDRPDYKGLCLIDQNNFLRGCRNGLEDGLEIAVHAIGDAANRYVLDAYENFYREYPGKLRIEHAQIVHPNDQKRFADMGIKASVQPIHCVSDVEMAEERLEIDTLKYSYPWKSFQDLGVKLLSGSDFPIESHNPFEGIAALSDRIPGFKHPQWHEKEAINIEDAISTYLESGYSGVNDSEELFCKGVDADILILPKEAPGNNLQDFEPLVVIIDGKIVTDYRKIIS